MSAKWKISIAPFYIHLWGNSSQNRNTKKYEKKNDSFYLKKVIGIFLILFSENDVFFNDIIYETRLNYLQFKTNPSSKG